MNCNNIIELKNISFQYPDEAFSLENISLQIKKGEKIVILGENGAGKSTLLLLLNGILKPQHGDLLFYDKKLNFSQKELFQLRKTVQLVFQDPEIQIFSGSVYEEVSFGPMNLSLPLDVVKNRVEKSLQTLDILHLKDKPVHLLSFGQKKLVCFASILAMQSEIVIFDEPTASLDQRHIDLVLNFMEYLSTNEKTIVITTHDIDFAYSFATKIVLIKDGKIIKTGSPQEIFFDNDILQKINIKKPLILEIFEKLNKGDIINNAPKNKEELFKIIEELL
ncbi:MAG: hypothetical protein A2086_03940 [Spirochaetes bacterium GWD1_27_9]|nr:MAG: hypothetical protein A2Z98_01525 [Spirochaetes bacterium GWB1_27_13]OHD25637.1 MAG: hypothetical protein A2Y34_07830 [Spirochaetes bacterium GWC1_27_15]OHD36164.1 MAG: hypothetical protein A2086_03940 [Spirochaetes bacterium GWD1_27_9]